MAYLDQHGASTLMSLIKNRKVDASKIDGVIDISHIPAASLERLIVVDNKAARLALKSANAQIGDTVQEADTGLMYRVVDDTKLNSEDGYKVYTAGSATYATNAGTATYANNAEKVNGHTVESNVPADAKFTDTVYDDTALSAKVQKNTDALGGHSLGMDVPAGSKLTDTVYDDTALSERLTAVEAKINGLVNGNEVSY